MAKLLQVLKAVSDPDCPLASGERHVVMVLAVAADSKSGAGFKSQATLAQMAGKSVRQLRRSLEIINSTPGTPVTIERTARFRSDGRGRTSDRYQLTMTKGTPTSGSSHASSGRPRPAEQQDQPDADVRNAPTTKRTSEDDQPDMEGTTNRTPTSGHRSTRGSTKGSTMCKARWTRVPQSWEPNYKHRDVARQEGKDFERELAKFRDHEFKVSKSDADAAFRNWLRNDFGGKPKSSPQRGLAPGIKVGGLERL